MGTAIRATAVSTDPRIRSSIEHASLAARRCIEQAGVGTDQIDVLINTGVYRDSNMAEPAMSALIQKEVGMNLDYITRPTPKAGFSFDLMNGACGVLNAVQVAGAFLDSGNAEYILVVSSDAHPSDRADGTADFPYATLGAAMLLERTPDAGSGFGRVHTAASSESSPGAVGYNDVARTGLDGRNTVTVRRDADYASRLADFAGGTARAYADSEEFDLDRTLLVTSQPTPGFPAALAGRLGVSERAAVTVEGVDGDPHTSALTLGYHQASARGREAGYDAVLFVAAGAGLTAACAVYREPAGLAAP
jgi:3-oxoacyl-[acyl-carrier-protein] synthase-3